MNILSILLGFKKIKPVIYGWLYRVLCWNSNVKIGKQLKLISFPDIYIEKDAVLIIGDNVLFRRSVEIRVHKASTIIIENSCMIDRGVRLLSTNGSTMKISEGASIGMCSILNGGDNITVGSNSLVSGFVYLQTSMHKYQSKEKPIRNQGYDHAPINIGPDAWLGAHVFIMPGCNIGQGAIVGSNAVVTRSVPDWTIVAGVPAIKIKERM